MIEVDPYFLGNGWKCFESIEVLYFELTGRECKLHWSMTMRAEKVANIFSRNDSVAGWASISASVDMFLYANMSKHVPTWKNLGNFSFVSFDDISR